MAEQFTDTPLLTKCFDRAVQLVARPSPHCICARRRRPRTLPPPLGGLAEAHAAYERAIEADGDETDAAERLEDLRM